MEEYRVQKSNVWMEVAFQTPKYVNDGSKFVEFLSIGGVSTHIIINSSVTCLYTTIFF